MTEWWTYRPSDFLLFSPRTYWRLIERYNAELWPLHGLALAAGIVVLALALRGGARSPRLALLGLAPAWAWVAWGFHWRRFTTINWAAEWFALAWGLQALVWLACAAGGRWRWRAPGAPARRIGLVLLAASVLLFPLLAPATGRPWAQSEVFGLVPDPTVLASLALALLLRREASGPSAPAQRLTVLLLWTIPCLAAALGVMLRWLLLDA